MKDLYTFDATEEQAKLTYDAVREAYSAFLDELRLPYLQASADSGKMGGNLSHEFHFASEHGEDTIISCDKCEYSINEELYVGHHDSDANTVSKTHPLQIKLWAGISKDHQTAVFAMYPDTGASLNTIAIKKLYSDIDLGIDLSNEDTLAIPADIELKSILLRDPRIPDGERPASTDESSRRAVGFMDFVMKGKAFKNNFHFPVAAIDGREILLTQARSGDSCPNCHAGSLRLQKAVEIGHTFHLGTRYSKPLDLKVLNAENKQVYVEMGCHGIGVSRLVGAVASLLADEKGLNWPLTIAPFGVMIVPAGGVSTEDVNELHDRLSTGAVDVAIDDRERAVGWKLNDADLVGYPFIVVMGSSWAKRRAVELQCRRLKIKEEVQVEDLADRFALYSAQL